jgi:tetratricopeptide (TPR) repeat protein
MAYLKLGRIGEAERVLVRAAREGAARPGYSYPRAFIGTGVAQLRLAQGDPARAVEAAREALALAERGGYRLEQGVALRALGEALTALGTRDEADDAFRTSRKILESIQSRPELAQTLLAHGRFLAKDDATAGRALIQRALGLFDAMGATGWVEEARAAL